MATKHTFIGKSGLITKDLTPIKAIRAKCLECSNFSSPEVANCNVTDCALYPFRFGKTGRKIDLTPEQRKVLSDRLRKMRKSAKKS